MSTPRLIAGLVGPVIFFAIWFMAPNYAGLGVMFWLATYWAVGVVPVIFTAAIPVVCFGLMGIDPWVIMTSFVHPALILIVGPTLVIVAAVHCGLVERMALFFIRRLGTNVRWHVVFWLIFATVVSDFAADVVVALALTPIAVSVLNMAGYKTAKDIAGSKSAMAVVIAVATGAGLGGILTPMAGGQAAITWAGLNTVLGGEVTAWSFTIRMLLPTTVSLVIVSVIFALLPLDTKRFTFEAIAPAKRLSVEEKAAAVMLVLAISLPYVRPWLPIGLPWIYTILMVVVLLLRVPVTLAGDRIGWAPILPWWGLAKFPLSAISVWPIAMSVSTLIGVAGTGKHLLELTGNFWSYDPLTAVGLWLALCISLAQVASDTGSAGMLIPILVTALPAAGINPVPWIMMTGYTVDLSFMVPTATGTIGVLYALEGRGHVLLPLYGFICAVACGLFSWLFWAWVIAGQHQFWYTLDVIK